VRGKVREKTSSLLARSSRVSLQVTRVMAAKVGKSLIKNFPQIFCAAVLLYLVLAYVSTEDSREESRLRYRFFENVCKRFETAEQLSSFVWSHRGHHRLHEVDASLAAQRALIAENVMNFDVDVSYADESFYVAHPSTIQRFSSVEQRRQALQTVDSFLFTLGEVRQPWASNGSVLVAPFVTMEPKFEDAELWRQLLDKMAHGVGRLPPSSTALVVNEPSQLALIKDYYVENANLPRVGVAIAYRSIPKTRSDFTFSRDMMQHTVKKCCQLRDHSPSLSLRHVYMPDVKLVDSAPDFRFLSRGDTRESAAGFVPWLVDDEAGMLRALEMRATGIVSNEAPAMLRLLRERFEEQC